MSVAPRNDIVGQDYRQIAPTPSKEIQQLPGPSQSWPQATPYRKASAACTACKKRRSRCSTERPCQACRSSGTECQYDESTDRRRKVHWQRNEKQLQYTQGLLKSLLETIRFGDEEVITSIVKSFQSDISLERMLAHLHDCRATLDDGHHHVAPSFFDDFDQLTASRSRETISLSSGSGELEMAAQAQADGVGEHSGTARRHVMKIGEMLSEAPFCEINEGWIRTSDIRAIHDLMSIYLVWDHSYLQLLRRPDFIRDLAAKKHASSYCSALLLNAICGFTQQFIRADLHSEQPYREIAMEELKKDEDNANWTTIQALFLMYRLESLYERNHIAASYRELANSLYKRLIGQTATISPKSQLKDEKGSEYQMASSAAAWGVYCTDIHLALIYGYIPSITRPTSLQYFRDAERYDDDTWSPFPLSSMTEPAHMDEVLVECCALSDILRDIMSHNSRDAAQVTNSTSDFSDLEPRTHLYQRLQEWNAQRPALVNPHNSSPAHFGMLDAYYHVAALKILDHVTLVSMNTSEGHAKSLAQILLEYNDAYTFDFSSELAIYPVYISAQALLPHLPDEEDSFNNLGRVLYERMELPFVSRLWRRLEMEAAQRGVTFMEKFG